jgi:hypothetical protein
MHMESKKKPFLAQFAREDLPEQPEASRYDESQQIGVTEGEGIPTISTDQGKKTMSSQPVRRSAQSEDGDPDFTDADDTFPP